MIFSWHALPVSVSRVCMGLCLGILPGIGLRGGNRQLAPATSPYAMERRRPPWRCWLLGLHQPPPRTPCRDRLGGAPAMAASGGRPRSTVSHDAAARGRARTRSRPICPHVAACSAPRDGGICCRVRPLYPVYRISWAAVAAVLRTSPCGRAVGAHALRVSPRLFPDDLAMIVPPIPRPHTALDHGSALVSGRPAAGSSDLGIYALPELWLPSCRA